MRVPIQSASLATRILGVLCVAVVVSGCASRSPVHAGSAPGTASVAFAGKIRGGQQAVSGASVQLYSAGNSGYGTGALPMLATPVVTDQYGAFSIAPGAYNCVTSASGTALPANAQTYIVATGGNPGLQPGTNNAAIVLMAALGPCSGLSASTFVVIDEVTTVASAWPLAPFMGYGAQVGTDAGNAQGLAAAFENVNSLVDVATGLSPGMVAPQGVTIPVAEINTLADILAPCVNSDGTAACTALFAAATPPGGLTPTNTLDAALDIALNPSNDVAQLFNTVNSAAPFEPTLASAPANWSLGDGLFSNPVPSVSGISPASLLVGGGAQTLTIDGAGFLASSTVTFNGVSHAATYVSPTEVTISLSTSDLYALGTYMVVVSNPVPGGGASSPVAFQVYGNGQNSTVVGSVTPNPLDELDAFDIEGNYAYILGDNGNQGSGSTAAQLYVVNIANPASMRVMSSTAVTGSIVYGQSGIRVQGHYVFLVSSTGTQGTNLLQIFDVSNPSAPVEAGSVPVPLLALGLWISGKYAYVISYVGDASPGELAVVDISDPASPTVVGVASTGIAGVHVADIKVVGTYAYVAGQSGGTSYILSFDVSKPASPYVLNSLPVEHSPQGLDIEGSYWYQSIYDANLLNVYSIANPSALGEVGSASLTGTCKPQDVAVEGTTAYVACYANSSVAVVDVSDVASPVVDGYISLPATSYPIFLEAKGRYVYSISNTPGGMLSVIDAGQR